jgi:hypothetical protein
MEFDCCDSHYTWKKFVHKVISNLSPLIVEEVIIDWLVDFDETSNARKCADAGPANLLTLYDNLAGKTNLKNRSGRCSA